MNTGIAGALGAALLISACAPDPYAWLAVVSADPEQVTLRYSDGGGAARPAQVDAMAEAQCAKFGRSARFEWDVALIEARQPRVGSSSAAVQPGRLYEQGNRHARFACVAA